LSSRSLFSEIPFGVKYLSTLLRPDAGRAEVAGLDVIVPLAVSLYERVESR
jgi:hypothetical protein